jgi:uncharacterized membrane protein HdeD (DUF308 family)
MTIDASSASPRPAGLTAPPRWVCVLLGIVMIVAGALVLSDVVLFTVVSTIFIGWMAIAVGAFEVAHAFWTKGWGGFVWQIILGLLYVAFGLALVTQPLSSALFLTYILGLALLVSGLVRLVIGFSYWSQLGWLMVLSGLFGIAAGLIILTGFPRSSLWVLGMLLSIDLLSHGVGWIGYAWRKPATTVR